MSKLFGFGEAIPGYDVPVLNEREVRAAAGILFLFALVSFLNSWLMGNFRLTRIFVIAFLIDFTIRIFINPKYSPSMIFGRLAVINQQPEWAGAPQKRFAWAVGWTLAVVMFYLIVIENVVGPINLFVCLACLTLLFFESAFGICLACKIYNLLPSRQAQHCPGGVCEVFVRHESQKIGPIHAAIVVAFLGTLALVAGRWFPPLEAVPMAVAPTTAAPTDPKCTPPDWAVKIGHAEMWKLHNNCK
ncbi:DUF4395 domain-containing protein [Sulfurisoma sediminicola]|uniref:Uncharacterized protein DUF4395 n=1 Tax=Sulfurisoma sediminicola TaxID=1381557 RepID=A0A497XGP8_9PROT|nr:DUF4395 domain-containing protein [Sulfurisoma sediminicola]RLJ65177.1 uncharacterized protein DUF4395 [Sulfurisoma sediminicola]